MNKVGTNLPIKASGFRDRREHSNWIQATATPMDRMKDKTFLRYLRGAIANPGRNMHLISGILGRARHGKPMRDEIPVFRDQVEDFLNHQIECLRGGAKAPPRTGAYLLRRRRKMWQ